MTKKMLLITNFNKCGIVNEIGKKTFTESIVQQSSVYRQIFTHTQTRYIYKNFRHVLKKVRIREAAERYTPYRYVRDVRLRERYRETESGRNECMSDTYISP